MPKIMKSLNKISRCQAIYRTERLGELCPYHHTFVLSICHRPGRSQDELARDICLNKSTVARVLSGLEEKGYVRRESNPADKRQSLVYPTDRMLALFPKVAKISSDWNSLISEGVSPEDMEIFERVLHRLESNATERVGGKEQ